ncbi:hypothetical protein SCB29_31100, partial [Paraburkholderia sp. SIMBA_055]
EHDISKWLEHDISIKLLQCDLLIIYIMSTYALTEHTVIVGCQSIHWPPYNSGFSGVTKHNAINARDAKSSPRNMRQNIPPRFSVPDF